MKIIPCLPEHLEEARLIYNYYILNDAALLHEKPFTPEAYRAKYDDIVSKGYPFLAAVDDAGKVVGFAYVSEFRHASAYRLVESTVYVTSDRCRTGAGKLLYDMLFAEAEKNPKIFGIMAIITGVNKGSLIFHKRYGFEEAGIWRNAAYKCGQVLDVHCLQLQRPFVRK